MTPLLTMLRPTAGGWLRPARPVAASQAQRLPDIVLDETMLYRSECFAEDLGSAADAALADLFPMLRVRRPAAAR